MSGRRLFRYTAIVVICVVTVIGLVFVWFWLSPRQATQVRVGTATITADIAATPAAREKGLGGTQTLAADRGMLFVFDTDGRQSFWMKGMQYSLDIIWLDSAKRVVSIAPNAAPESYPQTFTTQKDARYVLELVAGSAARLHIAEGSQLDFNIP